tara:strand:+ start:2541 stop:3524 length:984 start_codon:yes stop_codon:yes gene_type:complete
MILSKTPFRISFFGGGTDYPAWYLKHGGVVINTSINKFCYVIVKNLESIESFKYKIRYYKNEETNYVEDISHPTVRECIKLEKINEPLEIIYFADLPARSGLGTSSSFTVGLLNALRKRKKLNYRKKELLNNSLKVEQHILKEFVGSQDQSAAVFGGLNHFKFNSSGEILRKRIKLTNQEKNDFLENSLLIFTKKTREASIIAEKQVSLISKKNKQLFDMMELTNEALKIFNKEPISVEGIGKLLNEQWRIKKQLSPIISNNYIDEFYKVCMNNGAYGGKLLGAGSGGFMFILAPRKKHKKILKLLKLKTVDFKFEEIGSRIINFTK